MDSKLKGTAALITGASSGIGQAIAVSLLRSGANVVAVARRLDRLEQLARRAAEPERLMILQSDLTFSGQAEEAVEAAVSRYHRLDILVNSAGLMLLGDIANAPLEEWERMIDLNLVALMKCTHAALPHLLNSRNNGERGIADIVNISSIAGRTAKAGVGVYNATKFGVNAFSESLRQEMAPQGVRVSVVEPGPVQTELFSHNRPEQAQRMNFDYEILSAEDIAEIVTFIVTRPQRVALSEVLVRPSHQSL